MSAAKAGGAAGGAGRVVGGGPAVGAATADVVARLAGYGVATVYEAAGRSGLIDLPLVPLLPGTRIAGPARTVACAQDDNLTVHAAVERIEPGDVVVLAMPEPAPVGLIGDLLVTQIARRGAAAIVSNAAMRDLADLRELGLPIWSAFVRATGAKRQTVGALDRPVTIGGSDVAPGDLLVLDDDGATCVPAARVDEVLEKAEARLQREAAMRARLQAGELSFDIHGLRERYGDAFD